MIQQAICSNSVKNYELSCQHLQALRHFIESKKDFALILEDDSIPIHSFQIMKNVINKIINRFNTKAAVFIDISDSLGLRSGKLRQKSLYMKVAQGRTRCASSYIISKSAALAILDESNDIGLPIDWHYSLTLKNQKISTIWLTIPLFSQGSEHEYRSNSQERSADNISNDSF